MVIISLESAMIHDVQVSVLMYFHTVLEFHAVIDLTDSSERRWHNASARLEVFPSNAYCERSWVHVAIGFCIHDRVHFDLS